MTGQARDQGQSRRVAEFEPDLSIDSLPPTIVVDSSGFLIKNYVRGGWGDLYVSFDGIGSCVGFRKV